MAETSEAGASSSNEIHPAGSAYEVFISFRGKETRHGITDVLYHIMKDKGIHVFRDTEEIRHGEEIGDELSRAILDSRIYVVVFSKDYASSAWCLRELAMMVNCCGDKASGKVILPIFYEVNPSDVKLHSNLYRSALDKHREKYKEGVKKWEEALKMAGGFSGLEYKPHTGLGEFVSDVIADILNKLKTRDRILPVHLIGMDDRVKAVMDMLNRDTPDVRVVMLCGMGGIGKTTLAEVIFNKISTEFNGCTFLAEVRESLSTGIGGVEMLQKKLLKDIFGKSDGKIADSSNGRNEIQRRLSNRKVLIIFDDVSESSQLKKLVGNLHFFGSGTRIIVTTRDSSVCEGLMRSSDIYNYEMEGMSYEHALQLFNRHAFGGEGTPDDFVALSKQVIRMTGNLPLALEVIGGHLLRKEKNVWVSTLEKLKDVPEEGVVKSLRISYDSLGEREKQIFLDIACFDRYVMPRKYAIYMWEACGFYPKRGLDVLHNRSLIKVLDDDVHDYKDYKDKYWMHDLIREMGREIVRSECPLHSPGMRSRLWDHEEAFKVVLQKEGTHHVLAMDLGSLWVKDAFTWKELEGMSNLRFLSLSGAQLKGDFSHFRTKLLWLDWGSYESRPKPGFFKMDNLVILRLRVELSDDSMKDLRMGNLRVLEITLAKIKRMPDLSHCSKLELINLQFCFELEELHSSIGVLGHLKCLKIDGGGKLTRLPEELGSAKALQELILMNCGRIQELPESIGSLKNLRILRGNRTKIRKLPSLLWNLKSLEVLEIENCIGPESSPKVPNLARCNLSGLTSLLSLNLSGLDEIGELLGMEKLRGLQKLKLDVRGGKPVLLSTQLGSLSRLEELYLDCGDISSISQLPSSLRKLTLVGYPRDNFELRKTWVDRLDNLGNLSYLTLLRCMDLRLPDFASEGSECTEVLEIESLLSASEVSNLARCNLSGVSYLRSLLFSGLVELGELLAMEKLRGLQKLKLDVRGGKPVLLSTQLGSLSRLEELYLDCGDISSLSQLPSSLRKLTLVGYPRDNFVLRKTWVDGLDNTGNLSYLSLLRFVDVRLSDFASLGRLCSLRLTICRWIDLSGVERMDLLEELIVCCCDDFRGGIPNLLNLRRLKRMEFELCNSLRSVPRVVGDCRLKVDNCNKLESFEGTYREYHNKKRKR